MMHLYKIIFISLMLMGSIISVSANSWIMMWMGLEINLLSIIPLLNTPYNMMASEAALKYFITQALASLILIFSILMILLTNEFIAPTMNFYWITFMNLALLMKLGMAPLHFWLPEVIEGLNWNNSFIILTWQKIAPSVILMNNLMIKEIVMMFIVTSLIISMLMIMNQTSLRKIMVFSSINHMAWMLSAMMISFSFWLIYFVVYSLMNLSIMYLFKITNSFSMQQVMTTMSYNKILKFTFILNFISLAGMPPFIGFLPKWLLMNYLMLHNMHILGLTLIITTIFVAYVYIRIMLTSMILNHSQNKIYCSNMNNLSLSVFNMISILSLTFMVLLFNYL